MKKIKSIGTAIGVLFGTAAVAFAITSLFSAKSESSDLTPKTIFQFDLSTGMQSATVGPGDSITLSPTVYNDATTDMYVFIVVNQPTCNGESLYTYTAAEDWKLVDSTAERQVYAYAGDEMTVLTPGGETTALTEEMTMAEITNAAFSSIMDINVTITGYAIGTEDVPTDVEGAWATCQLLGNLS